MADGREVEGDRRESWVGVETPARAPVLYPQAARVLRRIIARLARSRRGIARGCEEEEAS